MKRIYLSFVALAATILAAQAQFTTGGPPAPAAPAGTPERLLEMMSFRNLSSSIFGGRILDIEVPPNAINTIYIGSADGGIFKSVNNGTTWTPIFDGYGQGSVGDFALAPSDPNIIYLGTGENTSTRSAHYGDGMFRSTDAGKTWTHIGLKDSKRIGQVVIDPKDPNIVYVASMGYLYKGGGEKGIYKTTDGGQSWTQVLKGDNDTTGFIDVQMDPKNNKVLYAASHDRLRRAWHIRESGPGAAIYKTTDAGKTWTKLTGGLPSGENVGRIGLATYPKDSNLVYAFIDMKGQGGGGQVWRSMDAGKTWKRTNETNLSGGTYYSRIFVDPSNSDTMYCPNLNLMRSTDGGKTFQSTAQRAHVDWHTVWINPNDSKHVRAGCDGGLYYTFDGWETSWHINNLPIGQFYALSVDNAVPYNVMGGTQDNGSWRGPSQTFNRGGIFNWHWQNILGGDGFYNLAHPNNPDIIFASSQFGAINRVDLANRAGRSIRPREQGQRANWMSPFLISPHAPDTIYWGGNKLHKSLNRGDAWRTISPDMTSNDAEKISPRGNVPHCTITTLDESRRRQGLLWVGTDDGYVWLTEDDGANWKKIDIPDHPKSYWVTRVHASPHDASTAWVAFTGFREDDWAPHLYKTTDLGKTWTRVSGLPNEQISVVKQDALNPNLMFVGTESSLQISFDGGTTWLKPKGLPIVSYMDLVIQERESDLVLGTHGRGFYIADITPYRQMTKEAVDKSVHLFRPTRALNFNFISDMFEAFAGFQRFASPNPQFGANIWYHLKSEPTSDPKIEILDITGRVVATLNGAKHQGLNKVVWNLRAGNQPAVGRYLVRLTVGTDVQSEVLTVESVRGVGGQSTQDSLEIDEREHEHPEISEHRREAQERVLLEILRRFPVALPFR